jgi:O-antigen biosynthesis protein
MAGSEAMGPRVVASGKFFLAGGEKFFVKGFAYGPFAPNAAGQHFAPPERTALDFDLTTAAGANVLRVYYVPPRWFLDLARERGLRVLVDIPWNTQQCFLDSRAAREQIRETVRRAVYSCGRHPAVFAFSVGNEIPADIVRWNGAGATADFIDSLVREAKRVDPECLCTYTNFPTTEFLQPRDLDFNCFNVYLHNERPFGNYLARLQSLSESKPLLLGELGIDSIREGEERQGETLAWQIEAVFRGGLAGAVVFSFTDDWFRGGRMVDDWAMGVTTADRQPRPAYHAVARQYRTAPLFPLPRYPRVSVVVAAYNAGRTLGACLESLTRLKYPEHELILVDDGSTDATAKIASAYPAVRMIRHPRNFGLSEARNSGIRAATGEIVAFTDADCRVDPDWLHYLVSDLQGSEFTGIGGPNLLPPEDSAVANAVMVSPGGPIHVMLTDRQAEHIPGCNMAFYKDALEEIGMFDPVFRSAGDDVDICWRLQQAGYKIGFSPSAVVWHYRRSTVRAYLGQQSGYGHAEALLVRKHPEYFNALGSGVWRGRIYGPGHGGLRLGKSIIYHGPFGSAGFQAIYSPDFGTWLPFCTTLEYHVLITLPLWILSLTFKPLLPLAITSFLCSVGVSIAAALQASVTPRKQQWWSRPLIGLLYFMQPIVRGWARYRGRFLPRTPDVAAQSNLDSVALQHSRKRLRGAAYASAGWIDRPSLMVDLLQRLDQRGWQYKADLGWSEYDVEIYGARWADVQIISAVERPGADCQIVKFRLRPRWSIQARTTFWSLCAAAFVIIGLFAAIQPWTWLLLLALPLFAWFVSRRNRALQSIMLVFLDKFAEERGFSKVVEPEDLPQKEVQDTPPPRSVFSAPQSEPSGKPPESGRASPDTHPGS